MKLFTKTAKDIVTPRVKKIKGVETSQEDIKHPNLERHTEPSPARRFILNLSPDFFYFESANLENMCVFPLCKCFQYDQ